MERGGRERDSRQNHPARSARRNSTMQTQGHNRYLDEKRDAQRRKAERRAEKRLAAINRAGKQQNRRQSRGRSYSFAGRAGLKERAGLNGRNATYGGNPPGGRWMKLTVIVLGAVLLFLLLIQAIVEITVPRTEGEYLSLQEAGNMTWLLADTAGITDSNAYASIFAQEASSASDGMLTFSQWKQITELFPDCAFELPGGYRKKEKVLQEDWYRFFDEARRVYDQEGRIHDMDLTPIGFGASVTDADGRALEENALISAESAYTYMSERIRDCLFLPIVVVERDGILYALREKTGTQSELSNIWLMEVEADALRCFWNDYELTISVPEGKAEQLGASREQVADLSFADGALTAIHMRTDKVSGKLLKIRDNGAEIEGQGFYPFAEELKIYRLYGTLKKYNTTDLCIGYDFTDFVIEDGEIQACLVVREEAMENIRVLVKTSDFGSAFHETLEMKADCDLSVISGPYEARQTTVVPAGEILTIGKDSELFAGGRVRIEPAVLTGHISLLNVNRSQGVPSYRGSLELEKQQDGIVVINEVLLEEYLYAVVPSEMPSSYPLEALKAQAVCARTYAYAKMLHAGLPAYGAHVDDSAGFQVYNNITENVETTKAVKETKGELVYYGEQLADTYYYSTSCGYGTNTGIWLNSVPENFPYLQAKAVNVAGVTDVQGDAIDESVNEADISPAGSMMTEEEFAAFITTTRDSDFEKDEAWYRWTYQVDQLDSTILYSNIVKRYEANPGAIYVRQADGGFANQAPVDPGRVTDIYIAARNAGGVAEELVIEGENGAVMVKTEHNIRYVLSNGTSKVIRQDGSEYNAASMLPSAFFTMETGKENGYVVGYSLIGGGFGHGVGLSQNGARSMAADGCDSDTILGFFYEGSSVKAVY